jgi:hypothetical protein
MNNFTSWQDALLDSWSRVWSSIVGGLPSVLGAIIIFAIGLILAFWAKRVVEQLLRSVKLEKFSQRAGIDAYLKKADIKADLAALIATFAEWLIIIVFFLAAVDILGLAVVSQVLVNVVGYVPNIIAAALILGAGTFVATVVGGLVRGALTSVDPALAKPVGKFARWLILIIAVFAAIDQLQIAQGLINVFYQGLTYTIVLAVGLSVGLGAKDLVAKILNDWYERVRK